MNTVGESTAALKPKRDPNVLLANGTRQCAAVHLFAEQISDRLITRPGAGPRPGQPPGRQRDSVRDASDRMTLKLGSRRELRKLAKHHLAIGEQVRYAASGRVRKRVGLVVLTDRRLIFLFHGMVRQTIEDLPLERITSVREKGGLVFGSFTVLASSTELVVTQVAKADLKALAKALRARISTGALPPLPPLDLGDAGLDEEEGVPTSAPAGAPSADVLDQLRQLGELRDAGVLSDDEFEAAKVELLGRL